LKRKLYPKRLNEYLTRRQLEQGRSLSLDPNNDTDKKILDLLTKRKQVQDEKRLCESKTRRILRFKDFF